MSSVCYLHIYFVQMENVFIHNFKNMVGLLELVQRTSRFSSTYLLRISSFMYDEFLLVVYRCMNSH
jgi:hypothetical protein